DKFYLKDTDGGAHPAWLEEMEKENRIQKRQVSLHDVAKGMIKYSSNANTDYLIALLGLESINETLESLDLKGHEAIYPLVGSVLVPYKVQEKDRKSTRLNSSHVSISYAVFCLKKKTKKQYACDRIT